MYSYEPARGHGLAHDPLNAIVGPRPIGWISSQAADGTLNLAPYSFFNLFNYRPPILAFASVGLKDSAGNIAATKNFVWNLVTRPLAEQMNITCSAVAPEVDEFVLAGLTPEPSTRIAVPRVAESPVAFECVLTQQMELTDRGGEGIGAFMTFGEVVMIHIAEHLIVDGVYDLAASQTILRAGRGGDYIEVEPGAFFAMPRPT
jgi:flavin reductase (DIM6/NTAB) family NADH-FMN oxidoreductase RutF